MELSTTIADKLETTKIQFSLLDRVIVNVSDSRGFEKSGVKLFSLREANSIETRFGSRYGAVPENRGFEKSGFRCIHVAQVVV